MSKKQSPMYDKLRRGLVRPATNVGELIDILSHVPRGMPISTLCDDAIRVTVASINGDSEDLVCNLEGDDE